MKTTPQASNTNAARFFNGVTYYGKILCFEKEIDLFQYMVKHQ